MANTLYYQLKVVQTWDYEKPRGSTNTKDANTQSNEFLLGTFGSSGMLNATIMWRDSRTVTSGSPNDDIDIYNSVKDVFGDAILPAKILGIVIVNKSATTGDNLLIGGAASNPVTAPFNGSGTEKVVCGPSSPCLLCNFVDGFTVTSGSADTLRVAYSGASGSIDYDIFVLGK